jgi:hypothetical protein
MQQLLMILVLIPSKMIATDAVVQSESGVLIKAVDYSGVYNSKNQERVKWRYLRQNVESPDGFLSPFLLKLSDLETTLKSEFGGPNRNGNGLVGREKSEFKFSLWVLCTLR